MELDTNLVIILLCAVVILSYLFNILSRKTQIPSVILLIATGVGLQYLSAYYGFEEVNVQKLVKILGTVGLIMIVLEAALDLDINKSKVSLIRNSLGSALFIFLVSALAITYLIMLWLGESFASAALYAIPLSIISSAIVIPSTSHLPEVKREFIIYESSFSDVVGIMIFNYFLLDNFNSMAAFGNFMLKLGAALVLAVVGSLLLVFILARIKVQLKFFLLFAMMSLMYAAGELIHLPALMIVLVFGMVLNNNKVVFSGFLKSLRPKESLDGVLHLMKTITAETSFLIRTFFFILFGYTLNVEVLLYPDVYQLGIAVVLLLLSVRYLYLRYILQSSIFPELFLMPRGLVTVLLFYSIPAGRELSSFNQGVMYFVVIVTSLLMMLGLLFFKKEDKREYLEGSNAVI